MDPILLLQQPRSLRRLLSLLEDYIYPAREPNSNLAITTNDSLDDVRGRRQFGFWPRPPRKATTIPSSRQSEVHQCEGDNIRRDCVLELMEKIGSLSLPSQELQRIVRRPGRAWVLGVTRYDMSGLDVATGTTDVASTSSPPSPPPTPHRSGTGQC